MGYTHYWTVAPISQHSSRFDVAFFDMLKIIHASPVPLAGYDGTGEPETNVDAA